MHPPTTPLWHFAGSSTVTSTGTWARGWRWCLHTTRPGMRTGRGALPPHTADLQGLGLSPTSHAAWACNSTARPPSLPIMACLLTRWNGQAGVQACTGERGQQAVLAPRFFKVLSLSLRIPGGRRGERCTKWEGGQCQACARKEDGVQRGHDDECGTRLAVCECTGVLCEASATATGQLVVMQGSQKWRLQNHARNRAPWDGCKETCRHLPWQCRGIQGKPGALQASRHRFKGEFGDFSQGISPTPRTLRAAQRQSLLLLLHQGIAVRHAGRQRVQEGGAVILVPKPDAIGKHVVPTVGRRMERGGGAFQEKP